MNTIKICKEVNISELIADGDSLSDFAKYLAEAGLDIGEAYDAELSDEDSNLPCYMALLKNADSIPAPLIPYFLEAAFQYTADNESLIIVSVTTNEATHKDWLALAAEYPGSHVTAIERGHGGNRRTVYCITFPGTPSLPD